MKNNRNLLPKRDKFKNPSGSYDSNKLDFKCPEATPRVLLKIKERMREKRRQRRIKLIMVLGFLLSILIAIFLNYV